MASRIFDKLFKLNIIDNYSLKDIRERGYISFVLPIDEEKIATIRRYLYQPIKVNLITNNSLVLDEKEYIDNVINVLNKLGTTKVKYNIQINIKNRMLLSQSKLLDNVPDNVNLLINASNYDYTLDEYIMEEAKIEALIEPIRKANLSALEKFLAVYDIVKNYKPYKNNVKSSYKASILNNILKSENEYIACAGFARLLEELLTRLGIACKYISVGVDDSYDGEYSQEEKVINHELHARNLVKIDDDVYNIHGIYISDSTWDNNTKYNLYLNSLMTFDRKKEAKRLEKLEDEDLLLDFHSVQELIEKSKYFIKRHSTYDTYDNKSEDRLVKHAYKDLYLKIMEILYSFDYEKCLLFFKKYDALINIDTENISTQQLDRYTQELLNDYGNYMLKYVNKKIDNEVLIRAIIKVQKAVYHKSDAAIDDWLRKLVDDNNKLDKVAFPYHYEVGMKEAYVDTRHK